MHTSIEEGKGSSLLFFSETETNLKKEKKEAEEAEKAKDDDI